MFKCLFSLLQSSHINIRRAQKKHKFYNKIGGYMSNQNPVRKWQKGESGNLNGRPRRGQAAGELIRDVLTEAKGNNQTRLEALIHCLYEKAMSGDVPASKLLLEYGWGRVPIKLLHPPGDGFGSSKGPETRSL
jgi:hypothetical protein